MELQALSIDDCVRLGCHLAAESNFDGLNALWQARREDLNTELILRIILTSLPETADPGACREFVEALVNGRPSGQAGAQVLDEATINQIVENGKHRHRTPPVLHDLNHASCPSDESLLVRFLVARAHQLDKAGLLVLVPQLVAPSLSASEYLRIWYLSNVVPLLRHEYEASDGHRGRLWLAESETCSISRAVEVWLAPFLNNASEDVIQQFQTQPTPQEIGHHISRTLKRTIGPWLIGEEQRRTRRTVNQLSADDQSRKPGHDQSQRLKTQSEEDEGTGGWIHILKWLIVAAPKNFSSIANCLDSWDGPTDIDLDDFEHIKPETTPKEVQIRRKAQIQMMLAIVYAAAEGSPNMVLNAHRVILRIAELMRIERPVDLSMDATMLPSFDISSYAQLQLSTLMLEPENLSALDHPLTKPGPNAFSLLQCFVWSVYLLEQLGCPMTVARAAKIRFQGDGDDQLSLLRKLLGHAKKNQYQDEVSWMSFRSQILWLWNWSLTESAPGHPQGDGIIGHVDRLQVDHLILVAMLSSGSFSPIIKLYIKDSNHKLSKQELEDTIITSALQHHDNASNGNRARGGLKKAVDMVTAFKPYFPNATHFNELEALFSATHSMSFYSLILQQGVPFQPVNIRVSKDPLSLMEKLLSQNAHSYTKLDDLISIARNLIIAKPLQSWGETSLHYNQNQNEILQKEETQAERRVIGMAVDAALRENDFETAYSYVVNRLDTSSSAFRSTETTSLTADDISWRAALTAGKFRPSHNSLSTSTSISTPPLLRRIEQRMELLSQALLLAPATALPEVLAAWRKCEEEMTTLLAQEASEDDEFNTRADRRLPGAFVKTTEPGSERREMGRGGVEEGPVGLFDLARGAAGAFSKNAFPLRRNAPDSSNHTRAMLGSGIGDMSVSSELDGQDRIRKRDLITDAATGALASGLGWMLGARPVREDAE